MANVTGAIVGAAMAATGQALINPAYENGRVARLCVDYYEGDLAQNDTVTLLAGLDWNTILDPMTSVIYFDDLGTSVTMDVGFLNDEDALVIAQDVATAAGNCSILKSVDIANYHKPLWGLAGYASKLEAVDAGYKTATIVAKMEAANPVTGTLAWRIYGSPQ